MEEDKEKLCKRIEKMMKEEEKSEQEYYELEVLLRECPVEFPEIRDILRRTLRKIQEDEKSHFGELLYLRRYCNCEKKGD